MKKLLLMVLMMLVSLSFYPSDSFGGWFYDDFESGNLNNWVIGGRQQGVNTAEVILRNGSNKAHLRHEDFTEITLEKTFIYDPNMSFSFEMETTVTSDASNTSNFYAIAGVQFNFKDVSGTPIGSVGYFKSTSTYPFLYCNPNPDCNRNEITELGAVNYNFTVDELLSQIVVSGTIDSVDIIFWPYASGWPYNMAGDVWVDDVAIGSNVSLTISPPSGNYVTTQSFDLTLIVEAPGLSVIGGSATLDGSDVIDALAACVIPGTLVSGGQTFRCPDIVAGDLGTGTHTLDVTLDLSDSSSVSDTVTWEVMENTEP